MILTFDPKLRGHPSISSNLKQIEATRSSETKPIVFPVPLARSKRSRAAPRRRISKIRIKRYEYVLFTEKLGSDDFLGFGSDDFLGFVG